MLITINNVDGFLIIGVFFQKKIGKKKRTMPNEVYGTPNDSGTSPAPSTDT